MIGAAVSAEARGLMAFWSSIEPANQLAFQRWHNCEHIPERVSIPGFLRGRRYRSVADPERFLMFYETRDDAVLSSAAYLGALNAPTRRTRDALGWFTKSTRTVFHLEDSAGAAPEWTAPILVTARFAPGRGGTAPTLAGLLDGGRFACVRTWRAHVDSASGKSNESAIHGARADASSLLLGESTRLDLLDVAGAQADSARAVATALAIAPDDTSIEVYSLEFALEAPAADNERDG